MPLQPARFVAAASVLALAVAAAPVPSATASAPTGVGADASIRAAAAGIGDAVTWSDAREAAEAVLARAQERLSGDRPEPSGAPAPQEDLTLTLRDLHLALPQLGRADRATARDILARPTDGDADEFGDGYALPGSAESDCEVAPTPGSHVCVHWVTSTQDRVASTDTDSDGLPDQVEKTRDLVNDVWQRVVTQGRYRAPLPDNDGPDAKFDVYLAQIGDDGFFGYCAPDGPGPGTSASGYCVLDNDYTDPELGSNPSKVEGLLQATVAHEFFHMVQFAYDVAEDDWFMEGTAMWMEDELFDNVNDSRRYLQGGPLTHPTRPLDAIAPTGGGIYVSWIFWRYLTERYPSSRLDGQDTGLPVVMREVWRRAQGYTADAPRTYSLRALDLSLASRDVSLASFFGRFGEANRHPRISYSEGAAYPTAPAVAGYTLSRSRRSITEKVATMPHLTNFTIAFKPDSDLGSADWVIRIPVNAPDTARGARAQITVYRADGAVGRSWVRLDSRGNGVARAKFRSGLVKRVDLTITNGGKRYLCNQGTASSCHGISRDNGLKTYFRASISRP